MNDGPTETPGTSAPGTSAPATPAPATSAPATEALMWEARAVAGRGAELLAWVRSERLDPAPARRETFTASPDRVLVITWWPAGTRPVDLPDPAPELLHRPVHRWRFTQEPDEE
ncbi:hypothetical protein ACTWP5_20030 [Streptomyces sp. 4N509B]|uniref:hypothetical protein n=1 Tax=Streptomyces sp. 4N509B TaxID=3457413 RepID=UPI003FD46B29